MTKAVFPDVGGPRVGERVIDFGRTDEHGEVLASILIDPNGWVHRRYRPPVRPDHQIPFLFLAGELGRTWALAHRAIELCKPGYRGPLEIVAAIGGVSSGFAMPVGLAAPAPRPIHAIESWRGETGRLPWDLDPGDAAARWLQRMLRALVTPASRRHWPPPGPAGPPQLDGTTSAACRAPVTTAHVHDRPTSQGSPARRLSAMVPGGPASDTGRSAIDYARPTTAKSWSRRQDASAALVRLLATQEYRSLVAAELGIECRETLGKPSLPVVAEVGVPQYRCGLATHMAHRIG